MPQFTKDTARIDPYKNFKFVVSWDGQAVAGVSSVSGLSRSTATPQSPANSVSDTSSTGRRVSTARDRPA